MIEAGKRGELDILIICHTDPIYHLPNRNFVESAFKNIPLVVEITDTKIVKPPILPHYFNSLLFPILGPKGGEHRTNYWD